MCRLGRTLNVIWAVLMLVILSGVTALCGGCHKNAFAKEGRIDYVWQEGDLYDVNNTLLLQKGLGEFFVVQLTDLHVGSSVGSFATARRTVQQARRAHKGQIDLVIVSGDLFDRGYTQRDVRRFIRLMRSFGCPWAVTLGETDYDASCDFEWVLDTLESEPTCYFSRGAAALGCGNFVLNVYEDLGGRRHVLHSFIFMDSGRTDTDIAQFNEAQLNWYRWAAEGINEVNLFGSSVSSTIVTHKPFSQFADAVTLDVDTVYETISADGDTSALFAAIIEIGKTELVLCGHKHYDSAMVEVEGVTLAMAPKCGYAGEYTSDYTLSPYSREGDICCGWNYIRYRDPCEYDLLLGEIFNPRLIY